MWGQLASLGWSLYGDEVLDLLGVGGKDEHDNPYIKKALERLDYASTHGYGPEVLSKMKRKISRMFGSQASSARASTQQRLMKRNVPVQVQEQVLRDLATSLGGERMGALSNIDLRNEQVKMQALNSLMSGSLQVSPDTGQHEAIGSILGTMFAGLDKKKEPTAYRSTGINPNYNYNYNPSLGQSWAANRYKLPEVD